MQKLDHDTKRVYMDLNEEIQTAAKMAALQAGLTLKGWLEKLVTDAVKPQSAKAKKK